MGPPSCMRPVIDRNVVMRRIPVIRDLYVSLLYLSSFVKQKYFLFKFLLSGTNSDFGTQPIFNKQEEQMTSETWKPIYCFKGIYFFCKINFTTQWKGGTLWGSRLRHCCTSRKVAGSIPNGVIGMFHWHNPSGRTMALSLTQPLTEMGVKAAGV
jgi:hypothetical protein